jgi:hypothetical protein
MILASSVDRIFSLIGDMVEQVNVRNGTLHIQRLESLYRSRKVFPRSSQKNFKISVRLVAGRDCQPAGWVIDVALILSANIKRP